MINFRKISLAVVGVLLPILALAQTSHEEIYADLNKAGGVYYAYPVSQSLNTAPPKGYEPFYISHFGRHGSRYLITDNYYEWVLKLMRHAHDANALTEKGEDVLDRMEQVWMEAEARGGDLSPLGYRQHRGIAERMYAAYPQVFKGNGKISARSTMVMRCAMSMDAFCERLKELNPKLQITHEASNLYMRYLNYHSPESNLFNGPEGPWAEEARKFEEANTSGDRLVSSIFSDKLFVTRNVNPHKFMWGMFWYAVGMQDIETKVSFYDLFEKEELFNLWQSFNYRMYVRCGNCANNHGLMVANARPLLRNIIESADEAISKGDVAATLRFGHDTNLIPLSALLQLKDCDYAESDPYETYKHFADFKISPMAGNIQFVFFRSKKNADDVIVKIMLNERETSIPVKTDIAPFYHWKDVRAFYAGILNK